MKGHWKVLHALLIAMLLAWCPAAIMAEEPTVFPLTESSIADLLSESAEPQAQMYLFNVVQSYGVMCTSQPVADVTYPKLNSKSPVYGRLPDALGQQAALDFVLDESQAAEPGAKESSAKEEPSLLNQLGQMIAGGPSAPVPSVKYDLLYVDVNGDRDLTNDKPLQPMKEPPKIFGAMGPNPSMIIFDYLTLKPSSDSAQSPMRVLPWLSAAGRDQTHLVIMTTTVHKARIRLGEKWYEVMMGTAFRGMNAPLLVRPEGATDAQGKPSGWGMMQLGLHQADGKFFEVACNAERTELSVALYTGAMGELRIDPGKRTAERFGAAGALRTNNGSTVWLGEPNNYYSEELVRTIQLPEGDYQLGSLSVLCGDMRVRLTANNRRLGMPGAAADGPPPFPIAIRADQPHVLRFADKPEIVFLNPAPGANASFRRGTPVRLAAMLLDPALDSMIRGLDNAAQKSGEQSYQGPDGQVRTIPVYASVAPTVSITNAAGKEVASGTMPFG